MQSQSELTQNEHFLKKAYRAAVIPSVLSTLSGYINILADGIIVGQKIGVLGLAAINLCVPLYLAQCVVGSFFVSGGVTEATNLQEELFGMKRLEEALNKHINKAPMELLPAIKDEIDTFVGDALQFDDITMLCLEYKERMEA